MLVGSGEDFTVESLQDLPFQPSVKSPLIDITYTLIVKVRPGTWYLDDSAKIPEAKTVIRIIPPIEFPPTLMPAMILQAPPAIMNESNSDKSEQSQEGPDMSAQALQPLPEVVQPETA